MCQIDKRILQAEEGLLLAAKVSVFEVARLSLLLAPLKVTQISSLKVKQSKEVAGGRESGRPEDGRQGGRRGSCKGAGMKSLQSFGLAAVLPSDHARRSLLH